ncbi:HAD family hydrolase [Thalassospira xiamenensis]|jgi:2-haloacid dehalogenase|uniref:HAD family hydrolase n=1 Tax=Thalassospira xiamenensis TaxID=220697 RepID=UPI001FFFAC07|nr:HAD family phosphatase [Thalassospira xiamenensis]MCK2166127.1 HAD family phosphatase [Thalassospira xiamenensis]
MRTIETVLFDLGGVLVDWDPRHLYRKIFTDPAEMERFLTEICHPHWNFLHDKGALRFAKSIPDLQHRYPEYHDQIAAWMDRWPEMMKGSIDRTVHILEELKSRGNVRLFALTNWSADTWPHAIERFGFLSHFEGILVSGQEKLAKPDPQIFDLTAARFKLDPRETLFIDDSEKNIQQAREMGFATHWFRDPIRLRRDLMEYGLL